MKKEKIFELLKTHKDIAHILYELEKSVEQKNYTLVKLPSELGFKSPYRKEYSIPWYRLTSAEIFIKCLIMFIQSEYWIVDEYQDIEVDILWNILDNNKEFDEQDENVYDEIYDYIISLE